MAHEITWSDNLFSTREPTWHGLGVIFDDYPTREEAQAVAHPWEPVTEPVYTQELAMGENEDGEPFVAEAYEPMDGYRVVKRSDSNQPLGVVSDTYQTVSNNELWDIAEALENEHDDVMYETGGSLQGGSKVWLMLRLKEPLEVPGDPHGATIPYYTLQNAHDGLGSLRGQATMTRIVCANTAHIADLDSRARGTEFRFRHSTNVRDRIEQAKQALLAWRTGLTDLQDKYAFLLNKEVDYDQIAEFEDMLMPLPPAATATERVMQNVMDSREAWREVLEGQTCEGIERSAYGLVQATVEYSEHVRKARSQETRFKRTYLDRNDIIQSAVKCAEAVAF